MLFFFFFKQKTAYEMRISDWSSDVCSSDLFADHVHGAVDDLLRDRLLAAVHDHVDEAGDGLAAVLRVGQHRTLRGVSFTRHGSFLFRAGPGPPFLSGGGRSEEHTSELQSLMRISYAVFCLKKKKPILLAIILTSLIISRYNHDTS